MPIVERLPHEPWCERGGVVDGAFRWRLGARPLDLDEWIELGDDADGPDGWIAEKRRVLDAHQGVAFAALDDIEPEAQEVAEALTAHLRRRWPGRFADVVLDSDRHPLEAASLLVPEDLVLMVERDGQLVFGGGSVCFPNRWDLRSKLGQTMRDVHEPVARLNDHLEPAIDTFLQRLSPQRSFWRLGWGLIDVPDGFTPPTSDGTPRPVDASEPHAFVRVERETLRRFSVTKCVLFTIRTHVARLDSLAPESAAMLAHAVAAMTSDVQAYKNVASPAR